MRRQIIIANLTGSFAVFSLASGLFDHVLMFILFGLLPGRSEPLPASTMLVLWTFLFSGICASWLSPCVNRLYDSLKPDRQDRTA